MASVFKRKAGGKKDGKESKRYTAQFYITDPDTGELVKVWKSTGETNKSKALAKAIEMERAAQGAMPSNGDKVQQMKNLHSQLGQEIARETITSVSLRKFFSGMMRILTGEEMEIITIKSWCGEWLLRKERESSKATMARYRGHVKAFITWMGENAAKPLETLTTGDVERWKRHLLDQGIAGKTALSYLKDLGQIYRAAIREGLVSFSPVGAVAPPSTDDSHERKPFSAEEVQRLIAAAPSEQWRGMILAAAFTGLRLGDVARLKWSSVNLETKMIEVMPAKTKRKKKTVTIPIHPDLLAYLSAAPVADDSPDAYVFPDMARLKENAGSKLSDRFPEIMKAAGVSRGKASREIPDDDEEATKAKGKGRVTYERGFHSLRHTFTTWLRTAGVSEEDRMLLTGHSTRDSHSIYSHADESILRGAMDKLTSLKEPKK